MLSSVFVFYVNNVKLTMKYNKQELFVLASQPSRCFDREGVLVIRERQDGFFRRSEGSSVRWFRLRGNLLFYLKGPKPWYEPIGVIVLGQHQVKVQPQDENGQWPFLIVWENGVFYKMSTFHESERSLWLKSIQMAPYEKLKSQIADLKEQLNRIRPVTNIQSYRLQKGIIIDMNEVPMCELALSCDNLLCDPYGRPPSPTIVVYIQHPNGIFMRYGNTEIAELCSNPSFSKTILFRASDGLTGGTVVRLVVYDIKERISETSVPMGFTSMQLSTIQEAQRLRMALSTRNNKTVGFITINGWSLEPSYIGTSPSHTNDGNSIDIPQKLVLTHRRSQSLPPRLGLKLKFPSYGSLLKQNFVNSHQVTYRFHSGLGGDITVHEIVAEPKVCYMMPIQLLDIFIQREKELLEELLSVGEICGQLQNKQLDLVSTHVTVLKRYCHAKKCMQQVKGYFKSSCRKDEASLEFAPINLHLQSMWVHNDTLNKTGSHDVITAGAFAAHTHKCERSGGLIRLVQQVKDLNSAKAAMNYATANKIQSEYDNVVAVRRLRDEIVADMECILTGEQEETLIDSALEVVKGKIKSVLALWNPEQVEESLSYIGWPNKSCSDEAENQTMSTIRRLTEQLSMFETTGLECDPYPSSSSSSKDTSPTVELPLSSIVPSVDDKLEFHNDYFKSERMERLNHSFRLTRPKILVDSQSLSLDSKRNLHQFQSTASLEQVTYKSLMNNSNSEQRKNEDVRRESIPGVEPVDPTLRESHLAYLRGLATNIDTTLNSIADNVQRKDGNKEELIASAECLKACIEEVARWLRASHAALRLRCESPLWTRENAALQTRRDVCFSQALTTVTSGLLCWLCSAPRETLVKLLNSGLSPLCGFEGLLSLYSTEKAMWGDMVVAVEDLHTVLFKLVKVGHSNTATPTVSGTRTSTVVHLPVSDSLHSKLSPKALTFTITAVLFNVGINEKATLAEALGETTPQYHSNCDNLDRLNKYYHKYCKVFTADQTSAGRASSRTKPLEEVMENLKIAVHKKVPKNIDVLHLAALATRLMNGIRFTSCKSAKDRTAMSVTLEQCSILATEYHLAEPEMRRALSIMRSEGCRRENTLKNIGVRKYAFTKKQVSALPQDYRPPAGTYGPSQT